MPSLNQSLADHISWHTCSSCSTCNLSIFGGTVDVAIFIFIWINECKMPHQMSEERNCISSTSKKQSCTNTIKYPADLTFACCQLHFIFSWITLHVHISTSRKSCIGCTYMSHWLHFRLSLEKTLLSISLAATQRVNAPRYVKYTFRRICA